MPPAGFEPAIPAGERPPTLALDRSATGIGNYRLYECAILCLKLVYKLIGTYECWGLG